MTSCGSSRASRSMSIDCFDECVEIGTADRFGRLYQHCSFDHKREVNRHRMKSVIDQALCDVECDACRSSHWFLCEKIASCMQSDA